jgi:SPP1 gp7 family putative phage head morphogenesis protein
MPTIGEIIAAFQDEIEQQQVETLQELAASYQRIIGGLQARQDALVLEVMALRAQGQEPTKAQIAKMARYRELLADARQQLDEYAVIVGDQIANDAPGAMRLALAHAEQLILEQYPPEIAAVLRAQFNRLGTDANNAMVAALQAQSPLRAVTLASFGAEAAAGIGEALLDALALGKPSAWVARRMTRVWGVPLTRALTIARTEFIRAYRAANLASMRANSDVVKAWQWHATLDTRVCMSCVAMHGRIFPLEETLDDHPNGRCVPLPVTATWEELGFAGIADEGTGVQEGDGLRWFEGLSEGQQREMLGPGKYEAWKAGKFELSALARETYDEDWGRMFREATLKELLGE